MVLSLAGVSGGLFAVGAATGIRSRPAGSFPAFRCAGGGGGNGWENVATTMDPDFDKKTFRHNLTRSDNYNRKGFGHKKETLELMGREYTSTHLLTSLR